ncbi:MAG: hypothetical protein CR982_06390 [Candidatus Cloacimonadota bacterium]|nr:MAG: hypothetical protein CR982_06390 [Candidatus Cloacimonadota bacterium]PIE77912.1 MAG: hypothetical protein CSA15_10495 [Candidatus Delongbacteria bacterium]
MRTIIFLVVIFLISCTSMIDNYEENYYFENISESGKYFGDSLKYILFSRTYKSIKDNGSQKDTIEYFYRSILQPNNNSFSRVGFQFETKSLNSLDIKKAKLDTIELIKDGSILITLVKKNGIFSKLEDQTDTTHFSPIPIDSTLSTKLDSSSISFESKKYLSYEDFIDKVLNRIY